MMGERAPRPVITGMGWSVPANIRTNDDPIFDWLKAHNPHGSELFKGYKERRVLAPGENLDTILVPAALGAMTNAGVEAEQIDLLLGTGSVSPFETPNEIARLHQEIRLPKRTWVVPLNNEFSNFNAGLYFADALIRAGRIRTALIVCASNWTRYVDYHTPQSISASDAAVAAVMTLSDRKGFEVVDTETVTDTGYFGTMYMGPDKVRVPGHDEPLYTHSTFHITDAGQQGFQTFGTNEPPRATLELLARSSLHGADIALATHQASSVLMDAWAEAIQPGQYLRTLEQFANMTVANVPFNVAYAFDRIERDNLVLLAIGSEMHTNAMLLRR